MDYETRVSIPDIEYPQINFVGRLIGPKGSIIQQMERKTHCKIIIRGKNTRDDRETQLQQQQSSHVLVRGYENDDVKRAVEIIKDIIRDEIDDFEQEQDLRRLHKIREEISRSNSNQRDLDNVSARLEKIKQELKSLEEIRRYCSDAYCVDNTHDDQNSSENAQSNTAVTADSQQ